MASTRNINTRGNYESELEVFKKFKDRFDFISMSLNQATHLPGDGLLPGRIPFTMLSENSADIESELLGLNTTYIGVKQKIFAANFKDMKSLSVQDRKPLILPKPFVHLKHQRIQR